MKSRFEVAETALVAAKHALCRAEAEYELHIENKSGKLAMHKASRDIGSKYTRMGDFRLAVGDNRISMENTTRKQWIASLAASEPCSPRKAGPV